MAGRSSFAALAVLISLCQAGQADILYGGPLSGGTAADLGGIVSCTIFNFSPAPVVITQRRIFAHTGAAAAHVFDTCNVPLGRFKSCSFGATVGVGLLLFLSRSLIRGRHCSAGLCLSRKAMRSFSKFPCRLPPHNEPSGAQPPLLAAHDARGGSRGVERLGKQSVGVLKGNAARTGWPAPTR